ncbi:hypothetical protein BgiMline_014045 [Biomphalaria glabrata]|uniref:Uncharacterized protein LOC106064356 n=1 Tax=Biomphalaria glabrata TaxID=6526 RepID=A0A9U8E952_BIOGL|nr:uncharacterized protein LOC106064356 [Biomphalaria glabrata]XP_013078340.2 uncharacterized protein LOC106064356 [Biomphalaria glabrata]KAI8754373.1 hypothetical protein BgiMline_012839 [Biomphalaria glabrata]KAI8774218.1 hypothetical protein BgiBS90_025403 [Biomphalaria glabrata]
MRMSKASYLIKNLGTIIVPALLFSLLVFQLHRCRSILALRNSYLLETLPSPVEWIWDALSGLHNEYIFGDQRLEEKQADAGVENAVSQSDHRHSTLLPNVPSLTVHYLWCIDAHFEMSHYILILSVIHQLRPDKIIIHYRTMPRPDPQGYWHWLEDLQRNVIMLSLRPLKNAKYCSHDLSAGVSQDDYDFTDPFGVFILGDIAVTNLSRLDVVASMLLSFSSKDFSSLHIVSEEEELLKSQLFLVPANEPFHISQSPGRVVLSCPTSAIVDKMKTVSNVTCVTMDTNINFDFLLRANSTFYRFARSMIYGSPNLVQIRMSSHIQIPNIVHIILVDGIGEVTPLLYASIKSAYIKGQVDYVYVHGPKPPKGKLWDMLHTQDELKVHYIPIAAEKLMLKNSAMNYGLFILLQYGGMMHFGDVIFMSPIPEDIMHSPAIATLHYSQYRLRHRSTNTAFLASTKGSKFIESILVTLSQSEISWPEARADDVATHVGELYPDSVLLEAKLISHLQCTQTCQVSGGHSFPAYTVRMIWSDNPPSTLDELKHTEGPAKNDVKQIIETVHLIHNKIL